MQLYNCVEKPLSCDTNRIFSQTKRKSSDRSFGLIVRETCDIIIYVHEKNSVCRVFHMYIYTSSTLLAFRI